MSAPYRIEGFAIISSDGAIAGADGIMPPALLIEADKKYYERQLDRVDAVVHGRHSHEGQPHSPQRRRIITTRRVATTAPNPDWPHALSWNPAGASFEEACRAIGVESGTIGVLGGTDVFDLFLKIGFDSFHLSRANKAKLPDGAPVFSQLRLGRSPEDILADAGLQAGATEVLDGANAVTLVSWTRRTPR